MATPLYRDFLPERRQRLADSADGFAHQAGPHPEPEQLADGMIDSSPSSTPVGGDGEMTGRPVLLLNTYSVPIAAEDLSTSRAPSSHPVLRMARQMPGFGREHFLQLELFHALRELLPPLNRAMRGRRALEGAVVVRSDDEGLAEELNQFIEEVDVGFIEGGAVQGLNAYLDAVATGGDEYGLGLGELQMDERGREIERLVVPNVRSFSIKRDKTDGSTGGAARDVYRLYQHTRSGERLVESPLVHRISYGIDNSAVWPMPMAWGLPFAGEIFMRMLSALANLWWKSGDPSNLNVVSYEDSAAGLVEVEAELPNGEKVKVDQVLYDLRRSIKQALSSKNVGQAADAFISIRGGKLDQFPLVADPSKSLAAYLEEHYTIIEGQIIGASDLPGWMFTSGMSRSEGIGSNRAGQEADLAIAAAEQRRRPKRTIAIDVLDTFLLTQGAASAIGNYTIEFEAVSVIDEKLEEDKRKTKAEADARFIENSYELFNPDGEGEEVQGMRITAEQRQYLEDNGVLMPEA